MLFLLRKLYTDALLLVQKWNQTLFFPIPAATIANKISFRPFILRETGRQWKIRAYLNSNCSAIYKLKWENLSKGNLPKNLAEDQIIVINAPFSVGATSTGCLALHLKNGFMVKELEFTRNIGEILA